MLINIIISFTGATNGSDYMGVSMDLVFTAGSTNAMQCINITIISDDIVEDNEIFTVMLTTSDSSSVVSLGNKMAKVTIMDASKNSK